MRGVSNINSVDDSPYHRYAESALGNTCLVESRKSIFDLHEYKAKIEKAFSICARDLCQTDVYKILRSISLPYPFLLEDPESLPNGQQKTSVLYQKSDLCIPRNETAQPRSQFLHSCICERFICSQERSAFLAAAKWADRSWEYVNRSQMHECGWETELYNSVLEITRLCSFVSGNK